MRFLITSLGATEVQYNNKAFAVSAFAINPPIDNTNTKSAALLTELSNALATVASGLSSIGMNAASNRNDPIIHHATRVRHVIKLRRQRNRLFPHALFADAQWDILLDLTLARLEGKQVMVSSVAIAAAVPTTTALRTIKTMLDAGLVERLPDTVDRRRHYLSISDDAFKNMMSIIASS
jgi:DNA-binding MarR family transcriptional regulator